MLLKILLIICVIFALHWESFVSARGRTVSRPRVSHSSRSPKSPSNSSGGGWFSWFRGSNSKPTASTAKSSTKKMVPPSLTNRHNVAQPPSQIGFAAYGNNYEANFHHSRPRQFRPMPHPYQSHFQPQTSGERKHFVWLICERVSFVNHWYISICLELVAISFSAFA